MAHGKSRPCRDVWRGFVTRWHERIMSKKPGWISYIGRLIFGTVREWVRLFALSREMAKLEDRRDELLLRLGKRYHQYLIETRAEPVSAVAETVADLRAVGQRMYALEQEREHVKQDTYFYVHPEFAAETPPWAAEELASRRVPPAPQAPPRPPLSQAPVRPPAQPPRQPDMLDLIEHIPARRGAPTPEPGPTCSCGAPLPAGAKFCPACGKAQPAAEPIAVSPELAPPRKCPYCGAELPFGAEFCPSCGGHIDAEVYEM
jgi:hypothetical protein